jgi:hypothetical protein
MDNEHIFALVEAIYGTYLNAIHKLALNAAFIDDIGHRWNPYDLKLSFAIERSTLPEASSNAGPNPLKILIT